MWDFRVATSGKIKLQWTQLEKRKKLGLSKIKKWEKRTFSDSQFFEIGFAVFFMKMWVTIINFLKYG